MVNLEVIDFFNHFILDWKFKIYDLLNDIKPLHEKI